MITDTTPHLNLPLPHEDNLLENDVQNLRVAFSSLDAHAQRTDTALEGKAEAAAMDKALAGKADAQNTNNALTALSQQVTAVGTSVPRLSSSVTSDSQAEAANSLAVKTAYDRGTDGVNAAAAALEIAASKAPGGYGIGSECACINSWGDQYVSGFFQVLSRHQNPASDASQNPNGKDGWFVGYVASHQRTAWATQHVTDIMTGERFFRAGNIIKHVPWTAIQVAGTPRGMIDLLPFRYYQLPVGWYFCNGTRHNNGTAQANALNALSAEFKADWGITNNGATTNVPNWFHADGRGPTMRAVNGSSRQVGSVEEGAIQNITGSLVRADHRGIGGGSAGGYPLVNSGALKAVENPAGMWSNGSSGGGFSLYFNAADSVRTANETIMLNRGMTPAIFLGV